MKKIIFLAIAALFLLPMLAQHCGSCTSGIQAKTTAVSSPKPNQIISGPKKVHWIDSDHYITYEWDKRPKIGTHILLVNVFNKNKARVTDLNITADAYMPSMKGSHDTGDLPLRLNKKNQYAIPVYFMMLGDWEIQLKLSRNNRRIGDAFVRLDIK